LLVPVREVWAMQPLTESYWVATDEIALLDTTCGGTLREAARRSPQHVALIDADSLSGTPRRWTYAELLRDAERAARAFTAIFKPGTHVAVWGGNSPEWVITQFGLALAGLVMVTVNPAYRAGELAYVVRQSRARGIIHAPMYRGVDLGALIAELHRTDAIELDEAIGFDRFDELLSGSDPNRSLPHVTPDMPAMIQYTSGTTGRPKGATLNHYGITNNARMMALLKLLDARTINLAVAPLFHTAGCVGGVLGSVQTGGALLLPSAFDAESMLDLIAAERVTFTFAVPTMLVALLAAQSANPRDLSSLKTVFSGGATVPVEIVRRVEAEFGVTLIIGYGQTETSPAITHTRPDDNVLDKSETIGRALPQVEIKIVDPETGLTQPVDSPGELCTRGFLVMAGYYDMPEATAATIDEHGWLRTGDLCTMDARGYCRITGRLKDLIIRGGENIYPREIEELLYTHPDIADVAVIGLPDEYWGEELGAVVLFESGRSASADSLREFVAAELARHKVPKCWFALGEIPTTASGKLQKFKLVEMYRAGELDHARL
jgi:fatty-acyl-CoA synthase